MAGEETKTWDVYADAGYVGVAAVGLVVAVDCRGGSLD